MTASIHDFVSDEALGRVVGRDGLNSRLPRAAYLDKDFLRLEYRRWLAPTWLFVARAHEIPHPGDMVPVRGHPYFVVRGEDGVIRAFHNACRHRGLRLVDRPCNGDGSIVCPYHAWTYGLDGALLTAPHFGGHRKHTADGLDAPNRGLVPVRCEQWHDWIFLNIDGEAEPLDDFVAPLAAKFADVDFGRLQHYLTLDVGPVAANWKLCMENNLEPYHVPVVHRETAAGQPLSLHSMVDDGPVMGCAVDIEGSTYTNEPSDDSLDNLDMSARYLLRAPNFFVTSYAPDKIIDSLILPDQRDPAKAWIQTAWYTTSGKVLSAAEVERWRALEQRVADEDSGIMERAQQGLDSAATDDGGVLSPAWEACLTAFYRQLAAAMVD